MKALFLRFFMVAAIVLAATSALRVHAEALAEDDERDIQQIITSQLAAFADDDADRAFETATPAVREAMGSSGYFLALVRGIYPMVYRPEAVHFQKPELEDGLVVQMVEIRDKDDKSWIAFFALEKQPDAAWRIGGCIVVENRWRDA
jgi:hypothetical protein